MPGKSLLVVTTFTVPELTFTRMKQLVLLFALATYTSQAQNTPTTPEARAQAMTTTMTQHLRLSDAQAAKVREINLASIQQLEKAKVDHKANPRQLKATIDLIGATRLESLKAVLTPVQFAQYQKQREKKLGVPQEGGPLGGGRAAEEYSN